MSIRHTPRWVRAQSIRFRIRLSMALCAGNVGQRIEHRSLFVEIGCDPPTCVTVAKRIQTDMNLAAWAWAHPADPGRERMIMR